MVALALGALLGQEALGALVLHFAGRLPQQHRSRNAASALAGAASEQAEDSLVLFLGGGAETPPITPALSCVMSLTTFFFCVYLAAVLARVARVVVANFFGDKRKHSQPTFFETALAQSTEALAVAPMLSVLMISARLRAMELGRPNVTRWMQICMYASTVAFFLCFLLDAALAGKRWGGSLRERALQVAYVVACAVMYGSCAAIVGGTLSMQAKEPALARPLSVAMECLTAMAVSYLLECLVLEVMKGVWYARLTAQVRHKQRGELQVAWEAIEDPNGCEGGRENFGKLMEALAEKQKKDLHQQMAADSVCLQFPLMLCVLLVGIGLRALQLHLHPEPWACIAMYVTTAAIVLQAAWGVGAAALSMGLLPAAPMWLEQLGLAPTAPASPDAGAGRAKLSTPCSVLLSTCWVLLMMCLYLGTALILAGVFTMEADPMRLLWPEEVVPVFGFFGRTAYPPISTAMRCVMLLTVVYFGVHLCLMVGRVLRGASGKWANSVLAGIQRSLAFAPMLCVMMIAVRMRAMQLKVRDPEQWAQATMYVATLAVVAQVGCSCCPPVGGEGAEGGAQLEEADIAVKVAAIALLLARLAASAALYLAVAALVVALFFMEPGEER